MKLTAEDMKLFQEYFAVLTVTIFQGHEIRT